MSLNDTVRLTSILHKNKLQHYLSTVLEECTVTFLNKVSEAQTQLAVFCAAGSENRMRCRLDLETHAWLRAEWY